MLPLFAALTTLAGLSLAALAAYVGWRRGSRAGVSLAVVLVSVAWWGLAYAVELTTNDIPARSRWGDLKYVGIAPLTPAWMTFVLQYTGRGHLVTRRNVLLLAIEPVAVLVLLLVPSTHDLVRYYPPDAATQEMPVASAGPLFWVHLVIANAILLVATAIFVATMIKLSRTYRQMALVLVAAALLPWLANLLHNFSVGWFTRIDLTPFAFTVTGAVLVWGLWRERLVKLAPLARDVMIESMTDGVLLVDAFGRISDVNPAGARVVDQERATLVGRPIQEVLPGVTSGDLTMGSGPSQRSTTSSVSRWRIERAGRPGELIVLRDMTERVHGEKRLQHLLDERSRVAAALQTSLAPAALPTIPGVELGSRFEPAGDGSEIGGDFFDVFPLGPDTWGLVLGDVSGKGAEAAAVTALTRYTLRTLADPTHPPSRTLQDLNSRVSAATQCEMHCTLIYAIARRHDGGLAITLCLAGHHPALVRRRTAPTAPVGTLGTALGLVDDPDLHDVTVVLAPGDVLCMFTDGLVEARDKTDMFGSERAAAVIDDWAAHATDATDGDATDATDATDDIAGRLVDSARSFHHGDDLADDLAILVLRVTPSASASTQADPSALSALP